GIRLYYLTPKEMRSELEFLQVVLCALHSAKLRSGALYPELRIKCCESPDVRVFRSALHRSSQGFYIRTYPIPYVLYDLSYFCQPFSVRRKLFRLEITEYK